MSLTPRDIGPPTLVVAALATSAATGLAGHWFAAWLLMLVGSLVFAGWSLWMAANRRRALQKARSELEQIRDVQRSLRVDLNRARNEARAVQQEARADLELMRAEVAVVANPDDPEDQLGR